MAHTKYYPADDRGYADHGWLKATHSFSFARYYDPEKVQFGALRVLNDDIIAPGMGFGTHPHDNMEIITIILDGSLAHKDSMGHTQTIEPNEVQVMSAGTGIEHSEFNANRDREVNVLQSWIFPEKVNVEPRYDQTTFPEEERINKWQTLVSPIDKDDPGLKIHQQAWIYRTKLEEGNTVLHDFHTSEHGGYIFVIDGSVTVNGQVLNKRDAYGVMDMSNIQLDATKDSDVLLYEVPKLQ